MPLPVLETPTYNLVVPSTKKKLKYRPFLVKEEKILMIAQESQNESQVIKAVKDIISACTFEKIDTDKIPMYDIEYIFLKIRSKSVGETVSFRLKCSKCDEPNDVELNLEDVEVQYPKKNIEDNIKLNDTVGITLKPINLADVSKAKGKDAITEMLIASIDTIYDSDNVYKASDSTKKEMETFVDSLSHKHLEKIQEFIVNQPTLKHTIEYTCEKCGHKNSYELSGLQSFFT
jgi:ribosomal protein L44E